jgi:hypothetical protein
MVEAKEPGNLTVVHRDKDFGFGCPVGERFPRMKPEFRAIVVSNNLDGTNIARSRSANAKPT